MGLIRPAPDAARPSLNAVFLGKEFTEIERFSLTGTVMNVSDPFSFDLPNIDAKYAEIIKQEVHRFCPIQLYHSDPLVRQGEYIPALMGVITRVRQRYGGGPTVLTLSGYDLGYLLTSCVPAWLTIQKGYTWRQLFQALIDRTWVPMSDPRNDPGDAIINKVFGETFVGGPPVFWGLKGPIGIDLNAELKRGRAGEVQDRGALPDQFVPPIQLSEGETAINALSRYARLIGLDVGNGSIVNVSALGHVQIFNPASSAKAPPTFNLSLTPGYQDNHRIKTGELDMDGSGLYTRYICYGSVIEADIDADPEDPHAGQFHGQADRPNALRVHRNLTWIEAEAYTPDIARKRAAWRSRQAEYGAWGITYELQGHSLPGPKGDWVPIVEGNNCTINDGYLGIQGTFYIEQTVREQASAPKGTTTRMVLRKSGLLAAVS